MPASSPAERLSEEVKRFPGTVESLRRTSPLNTSLQPRTSRQDAQGLGSPAPSEKADNPILKLRQRHSRAVRKAEKNAGSSIYSFPLFSLAPCEAAEGAEGSRWWRRGIRSAEDGSGHSSAGSPPLHNGSDPHKDQSPGDHWQTAGGTDVSQGSRASFLLSANPCRQLPLRPIHPD